MPVILLETRIKADIERVFDLSRSIDLHKLSTAKTKEEAIDGVKTGLIRLHESVTWRATHFGIRQQLTTIITAFNRPVHFCDEQQKGIFKSLKHDHFFQRHADVVLMTDRFEFESPFGILGKAFNRIILTAYLKKFLTERNALIKEFAETDKGNEILI